MQILQNINGDGYRCEFSPRRGLDFDLGEEVRQLYCALHRKGYLVDRSIWKDVCDAIVIIACVSNPPPMQFPNNLYNRLESDKEIRSRISTITAKI